MEENVITGIVIAGNIGIKVQFDCASIHLEKAS